MIKNILKSKLFLLCSTLFCSLVVSVFCFGTSSRAYNGLTEIQSQLNDWGVYPSDEFYNYINNYWSNHSDFDCVLGQFNGGKYSAVICSSYSVDSNTVWMESPRYTVNYNINNSNVSESLENSRFGFYLSSFVNGQYAFFDDYPDNINWENPFYSANIVAPNMSVTYRDLSSTPVVDVPLNINVNSYPNLDNEYYVQLFGLINYDENYYVQNTRDGIVYNGMDIQKYTSYVDIVTPQELLKPSDLSFDMLHLRFTNGWYNNYPSDSLFSFTFQEGIPSPLQASAISKFNNFRKNATFADNTVYVYARYFLIDDDNNFVVGPWRIWKSYNPNEFTTEVPNYYLPYAVVPGTTGTNTSVDPVSTSSPEPSAIDNQVQTNPTVNVTVNQNVPNYPDYPTIASYNKDNLLVDTMNQLNSLQGFFGEFGSFLVTAFAFMPAWIWAIIGVGFSLSIVVMFLKIL